VIKTLITISLCLSAFVAFAQNELTPKPHFHMDYTQSLRFCASMAVNYSALASIAQHTKDDAEGEDKFKAYLVDQEENASTDDVEEAYKVIGENVWKLRKDVTNPTYGAMQYYDSCVRSHSVKS
jgi:hypothetical protein